METTPVQAANRLGLDYAAEAAKLRSHDFSIIDAHAHIVGGQAVQVYRRAAELYGVGLTYSMTPQRADRVSRSLARQR